MSLEAEIKQLEKEIEMLEKKFKDQELEKERKMAQIQASIFIEKMFIPFFEGLCEAKGTTLEDGIADLIQNDETLDEIITKNAVRTNILMKEPEFQIVLMASRPIADKSDEWIKEQSMILIEVMNEIRPTLAQIIWQNDKGRDWFENSLIGLRNVFFRVP